MELFHISGTLLGSNSIIEPGNFGRIIALYGQQHNLWQRETEIEKTRISDFNKKPSRLNSCFCFLDFEAAHFFRARHFQTGVIYAVEIVDNSLPQHIGDMNRIQPLPGLQETWREVAHAYWTKSSPQILDLEAGRGFDELLTSSAIRVLRRLENDQK